MYDLHTDAQNYYTYNVYQVFLRSVFQSHRNTIYKVDVDTSSLE